MKVEVDLRPAVEADGEFLKRWLLDPGVLRWFPMCNEHEVLDSIRIWMVYARMGAAVTAEHQGMPVAMSNLYVQPFQKLKHQALFSIVVHEEFRGKGVGSQVLNHLMKLAKESFSIEILHLEVYDKNPAIFLYKKLGFVEYGRHPKFIKEENGEYVDKVMMKKDLNGRS